MAYVNVAEWKAEQVSEWLKGLDSSILPYLHLFLSNEVNGHQLLNVRPEDLDLLGIKRLGHQELILEAVEHLRNFHYELDRENLQLLALRLSCQAHSLHNELRRHTDSQPVSTQTLADVASVVRAVKPLVCWLDRSPFSGQLEYSDRKIELLKCGLEIATCAQRDRFAERPVEEIRTSCGKLARIADGIIQDIADPLILQPASLDLATLRKRGGDDLGFFIVPSFHGVHQIGEIKFGSPAHQCGKVEEGDEVVQVNYQTIVGWQQKKVIALFEESITDVFLTLKKRPRHTKVYGQIYMKPYRLPSKKRAPAYTRWHDNLPSPRPELLTIPDFEMPLPRSLPKSPALKLKSNEPLSNANLSTCSDSEEGSSGCDEASLDYELEGHASPTSMRLYLPKPRVPVQRRATITGASPTSLRPPVDLEKFWRELKFEKRWRGSGNSQDVDGDKILRNKSPYEQNERPSTCLGFEKSSHSEVIERVNHGMKQPPGVKAVCIINSSKLDKKSFSEKSEDSLNRKLLSANFQDDVNDNVKSELSNNDLQTDKRKERRFVTRLELVVDSGDSKIEFTQPSYKSSVGGAAVEDSTVFLVDHDMEDEISTKPREKTRKISAESQVGELATQHRERGRLDKSFSTPAYDLSGLEGLDISSSKDTRQRKPSVIVRKKDGVNEKSLLNMKETIAETGPDNTPFSVGLEKTQDIAIHSMIKFPLPDNSPRSQFCPLNQFNETAVPVNDPACCDTNLNPVLHGRVVETINRHLLDSNLCKDDDNDDGNDESNLSSAYDNISVNESTSIKHETASSCRDVSSYLGKKMKSTDCFHNDNELHLGVFSKQDGADENFNCNQSSAVTKVAPMNISGAFVNTSILEQNNNENDPSTAHTSVAPPSARSLPVNSKRSAPVPPIRLHNMGEGPEPSLLKIPSTPPDPPPRPSPPSKSPSIPSESIKATSLRAIISSKSGISRPPFNSPKVLRKKNPFLAKRRSVAVKELGVGDYQGWLYRRLRLGGSGAQWIKGWFVLKGTIFYGFKSREALRADCFMSLPGFTISPAEEVKSRKFAFKVYHTGTVFYFAAESEEELAAWLDCLSVATLALDLSTLKSSASEGAVFSETEDEGEESEVADSCFPSPKMRKLTNFLSGHSSSFANASSSSPKPAHSHQNLASSSGDSKTCDIQKKFGSLKKLGYRSKNLNQHFPQSSISGSSLSGSEQSHDIPSAPHSLDRKYLRFLSSSKNQNIPVPTAQFRSYRRVVASENCTSSSGTVKMSEGSLNSNLKVNTALSDIQSVSGERSAQPLRFNSSPSSDVDLRRSGRGAGPRNDDVAGLLTLEQFMLLRQEEERQQNELLFGSQSRDRGREGTEGYTEDPVSTLQRSLERRRTPPVPAARTILTVSGRAEHVADRPAVAPRNINALNDSHECRDASNPYLAKHPAEIPLDVSQRTPLAPKQLRLKNAAMYQPPPVSFTPSPILGPSFEMHLDHRITTTPTSDDDSLTSRTRGTCTGSKLRQLFSPKHGHANLPPTQHSAPCTGSTILQQKTILGSPRLHRALFRHGDSRKSKVASQSDSSDCSGRLSTSPSPISSPDWTLDCTLSPSPKPTMGVAMLGKKPIPGAYSLGGVSCASQIPTSPPPDYPGLEYPPVFEPGTYSLSDTSSLLCPSPPQTGQCVHSPSSEHSTPHSNQR